jgi:hypothetical protein
MFDEDLFGADTDGDLGFSEPNRAPPVVPARMGNMGQAVQRTESQFDDMFAYGFAVDAGAPDSAAAAAAAAGGAAARAAAGGAGGAGEEDEDLAAEAALFGGGRSRTAGVGLMGGGMDSFGDGPFGSVPPRTQRPAPAPAPAQAQPQASAEEQARLAKLKALEDACNRQAAGSAKGGFFDGSPF